MAAVSLPFHVITKQDLEDYRKSLALEKGCPVSNIDRTKAHWEFIMHKEQHVINCSAAQAPEIGTRGLYTKQ